MAVGLDTRLDFVVGKDAKRLLTALDVRTVGELLAHYPRRYDERGVLSDLSTLSRGAYVTVQARVRSAVNRTYTKGGPERGGRKPVRTEVVVTDGTGDLQLVFFKQPWRVNALKPGALGLFAGKVGEFNGRPQLLHPECVLLDIPIDAAVDTSTENGAGDVLRLTRPIIPVYPTSGRLTSWQIAGCTSTALDSLEDINDPVPEPVRARRGLVDLRTALDGVHRPYTDADHEGARARLRYDEALVTQVVLARRRHRLEGLPALPRKPVPGALADRFDQRLPFTLTDGQSRVGSQVAADLARSHPMHRLLQGEVGSGKTVVALRAMLQVIDAGGQAALLAPTEVLAQQHHRAVTRMLGDLALGGMLGGADGATAVGLLTGSLGVAARRQALLAAASGTAGIVVGTHALLEESVQFADLGLVVVDEQHRFGVEQRAALTDRGSAARPHVLVMTATPIPRTVAMTVFGDLEVSVLAELPPGRRPVQTSVVPAAERPTWLERGWQRVCEEVSAGRQAYVVCPRIGDGSPTDPQAGDGPEEQSPGHGVLATADELGGGPLAGVRVGVLHGRLAPDDKDRVMDRFAAGEIDVLVATTVVEVGVDVPNATVMVVMDADRYGLSQLHQLRGRVGRGAEAGLCLLVSEAPPGSPARERLDQVAATTDGFEVSRLDVALRREGDVLGALQSGSRSSLRLLSVVRDEDVIVDARADAAELVAADPALDRHPALARRVAGLEDTAAGAFIDKT